MTQVALPREYRSRPGSGTRAYGFLALVWFWGVYEMSAARHLPVWFRVALPVMTAAFIAFLAYSRPRRFTVIDREGISVRNVLLVRRLRWAELHDIRVESPAGRSAAKGGPRAFACAYLADGKRVGLPCVDEIETPAIRTEAALVRSLWTELRGPQWRPEPDAEARIARAAARREWWTGSGSARWGVPVAGAVLTAALITLSVVFLG
ncbi:PH domain-containing protein [Streptomyces sp. NPDC006544]|uniref:PH domain-containing protein n=1 Tax=Streptomyces sp. NPDC006544 TaxID=3154583 RepID=UPI0033BF0359